MRPVHLTCREKEILKLIAHEYSSREIARQLFLSYETIKSHRKSLRHKFNVKNTAGLIRRAYETQFLELKIHFK